MKTGLSAILGASLLLGAGACSLMEPNDNVVLAVTNLAAPTTASPNTPFTVTLTLVTGGCTTFNRIDVQRFAGGVRLIPLGTNASIRHNDVSCPADIREEPHDVQLDPPFANPFQVYVEQGLAGDPVTATVQIQ
jgi:hypothetical protein